MHQRIIKHTILFLLVMLWMIHPSIAATTQTTEITNTKAHVVVHSKKTTSHKTTSASSNALHEKKSASKKTKRKKIAQRTHLPNDRTALVPETPVEPPHKSLFSSIGQRLAQFVHSTVSTLRYSAYKLGGTHFDTSRGVYILDCSDYIDHILKTVYPDAYFDLAHTSRTDKPTTQHYYEFFRSLPNDPEDYWARVDDVEQLQAGDILVFRYKHSLHGAGGHVMVVMDKPIREDDAFLVRVADSAPSGHSQDTRQAHVSGIGIGTLLLRANPKTGEPFAYAWKIGARWDKNVNIAMARPMSVGFMG